ncbi:MAG: hypothetical protein LBM05_02510 [Endomicrobium sp.]|jgi:hypothetical protein|nr:hypothetical protein [Endomicrobium sp.]
MKNNNKLNILIIGEYSGFAQNLKIGLQKLGCKVVHFHYGDGWKKIKTIDDSDEIIFPISNIYLSGHKIRGSHYIKGFYYSFLFRRQIKKYISFFDVVLVVNSEFIRSNCSFWLPYFSFKNIKSVLKHRGKIYLSACGGELPVYLYINRFSKYDQLTLQNSFYFRKQRIAIFNKLLENIIGIIPVMYEYAEAFRYYCANNKNLLLSTIPLPMASKYDVKSNIVGDKIKILYGINRENKGNAIILAALEKIESCYSDIVDITIVKRLSYAKYVTLIDEANILVDQCRSYSYGMNALLGLAAGKVVLSGNEPECEKEFGQNIPIINIIPDVDQIFSQLEKLLLQPDLIAKISAEGRVFVNSFHDSVIVAKQYVKCFME